MIRPVLPGGKAQRLSLAHAPALAIYSVTYESLSFSAKGGTHRKSHYEFTWACWFVASLQSQRGKGLASHHVGVCELKRPILPPLHLPALKQRVWTLFHGKKIPHKISLPREGPKIIKTDTIIYNWSWSKKRKTECVFLYHCRKTVTHRCFLWLPSLIYPEILKFPKCIIPSLNSQNLHKPQIFIFTCLPSIHLFRHSSTVTSSRKPPFIICALHCHLVCSWRALW